LLDILPCLVWLAALTSVVLLVLLWRLGELGGRSLVVLGGWFLAAAYCQFSSGSATWGAVGLFLQTLLAVYLLVLWKLSG
jgi:hypothetical protein